MTEQASCPECGKPLPAGSSHDLCPACLMGQVMASRTLDTATRNEPAASLPSPEEIADKFPQFEVVECLGRGGMGVVYKARQKSLDRWVAIKVLAPERVHEECFAEHFEREAKTLARMSHPNIVTVFDHGETGGLFYIVMEYVDGVNLRDLLREAKMEPGQALAIIPLICDALEYAHDKGVVHRDIKPENILLDREGRVKIADFGIASLVGVSGEKSGTPPYMAPEQENGIVDRRADIYALGVVLYEMLTGERPNKELVAPSKRVQIDVRLDEIVLRALEKTPELRYQTAGEFRTVLETMAKSSQSPDIKPQTPFDHGHLTPSLANRNARFWRYVSPGAFLLAYAGMLLLLATTGSLLPARVASHFGAEGKADGWMSRTSYLTVVACMPLLFGGMAILLSWLIHRIPAQFINIPRRDFWLTTERRPQVARFLRRRMFALAVLMTAFFAGLHLLTIHANQSTPVRLSLDGLLALVIAFLLALLVWTVCLLMRLADVDKPLADVPTVLPTGSSAKRHPWPIWLTFGLHAMMLVVLTGILIFTVPRFTAMLRAVDVIPPLPTRIIIGISEFTTGGGFLLVPILMALDLLLCWSADTFGGRKLLAWWAALGMLVLIGLGGFIVGAPFLMTSRLIGHAAESPATSLPAEFSWRKLEVPMKGGDHWESTENDQVIKPVVRMDQPGISSRRYAVIGEIKYENVEDTAYLEMWNHFQPSGSYFTRTLAPPGSGPMAAITGSSDWRPFTLSFDRSGTTHLLSKLEVNLNLPAKGKVYLRGIRLVEEPTASLSSEPHW